MPVTELPAMLIKQRLDHIMEYAKADAISSGMLFPKIKPRKNEKK